MFREYAVEPAVISSWERARFFLDSFGAAKGRFLADYPARWITEVWKALKADPHCPDVEKKKIALRLERLDKRALSPRGGRPYDRRRLWLDNVLDEHQVEPFAGIVATETRNHHAVIDAAEVDDSDPRWAVHSGTFVARDAQAVMSLIKVLITCSSEIVWIDPYFRASSHARRAIFTRMCSALRPTTRVTVHVNLGRDEDPRFDVYRDELVADLGPHLPVGLEVRVRCWAQRAGGDRLHNRFIVTDIGGIKFGDSITQGAGVGEQDHLSALDEPSRIRLLESYQDPAKAFDPVGHEFVIVGRRRS